MLSQIGILWRPQDFNTTRWQTPFSDVETSYQPPKFSTPNSPSSSNLAATGTSTKRTREGETINRGASIPPIQDPEPHLLFLPQFDALRISTWENEDNGLDVACLHLPCYARLPHRKNRWARRTRKSSEEITRIQRGIQRKGGAM